MIDKKEVKEICLIFSDDVIGGKLGVRQTVMQTLSQQHSDTIKEHLEMGVKFYTDAPVKALQKVKGKVRKVILNDGTVFEGETVILVAGYEKQGDS